MKTFLLVDLADQLVVNSAIFADDAIVSEDGAFVFTGGTEVPAPEGTVWHDGPGAVGWGWDGEATVAPAQPPLDLDALKASLKAAIDQAAERERLRYITAGAGQAMTYARKVEQAKAVQAAADPQPADYPMLAASIGIDGADIVAVAGTILAMDAAWEQIGAAIEGVRLAGKKAVDLAADAAAAQAVEVVWPMGA